MKILHFRKNNNNNSCNYSDS